MDKFYKLHWRRPKNKNRVTKVYYKLVLLRERSDRKGPRAPEAELGKRNSAVFEF